MLKLDLVEKLKEENQRLSQELKQRLFELSILYEISQSISYTLDYDDFLRLMMDSLHRIIDYDICTSLIILEEGKKAKIVMRIAHPVTRRIVEDTKRKVIGALSALSQKAISEEGITLDLKGEIINSEISTEKINSSFDVPLFVRDEAVGMLNVASTRD